MVEPEPLEDPTPWIEAGELPVGTAGTVDATARNVDDEDYDEELEEQIERARLAGGVELELTLGFVRVRRCP